MDCSFLILSWKPNGSGLKSCRRTVSNTTIQIRGILINFFSLGSISCVSSILFIEYVFITIQTELYEQNFVCLKRVAADDKSESNIQSKAFMYNSSTINWILAQDGETNLELIKTKRESERRLNDKHNEYVVKMTQILESSAIAVEKHTEKHENVFLAHFLSYYVGYFFCLQRILLVRFMYLPCTSFYSSHEH